MSTTSLAVACAWIEAANLQDIDRLLELSSDDIEIIGPRGSARGPDILRDWLARAGLRLVNARAFQRGGAVVIEHHGVWRSMEAGAVIGEADVSSRFEVQGGRVMAYERFDSLEAALASAGLDRRDETTNG